MIYHVQIREEGNDNPIINTTSRDIEDIKNAIQGFEYELSAKQDAKDDE